MSTNKPVGGAQFTPGPWHLEHDVDGIPLTIIGSDGSAIGTVETWNDCTEGNRLVLTAAPAMYAIIKDMREAFYVKGTRKALLEVMERSKDVIAQAEGRQG